MNSDKIHILIVEDDMIIGNHISIVLAQAGYEVMGIMPSGESALVQIEATPPDLILMDISLKGELDGIETAKYIKDNFGIPLIFLTANSDQSTFKRAKEARPLAFIAKPFNATSLVRAIELAALNLDEEPENIQEKKTSENISTALLLNDRIFVRNKNRMVKLYLKDIQYIEADRNYCKIYAPHREFLLSTPMKNLAEQLNAPSFQRIHRSYIINMEHIDELDEHFVFIGKTHLPISKSYKVALFQRLKLL